MYRNDFINSRGIGYVNNLRNKSGRIRLGDSDRIKVI